MKKLIALLLCGHLSSVADAANLLEVYLQALQGDPQLREAENNRLALREAKPQAVAALLPQVSASGSSNLEKDKGSQNTIESVQNVSGGGSFVESFPFDGRISTTRRQFGIDLKETLFKWEDWVALRRADSQVAQAEADYQVAQQDLIARVAQSYFNILAAQDVLDAQEGALESITRQLFQAQKRYEAGLIAIADVEQAQAARDSAAAAVISAKRTLASSIELLREITGESFHRLARPVESIELADPNPASEDTWVKMALAKNLTLISSRLSADIAEEKVASSNGSHLPSLEIVASRYKSTASGNFTNADGTPFGSSTLDQYQNKIGIQFTVPLFSGGAAASSVREAVYQHRAAKARVERVTRQTEHDARDAYLAVTSEISRVKALQKALESTSTALHATELSYEAGTRAAVDVLESRRLWLQAKTDYARSRYDYMLNILKLQESAGMLSLQSLTSLNMLLTESKPNTAD